MTTRARTGRRHGVEAGLAVLMVATLLWAGGLLEVGELAARPALLGATADPGAPRLVRVLHDDADVLTLAWSPDNRRLASGDLLRRTASVWNAQTGTRLFTLDGQAGGVRVLAWSPDGKYLATGRSFVRLLGQGVSIKLWDGETGRPARDIPSPFPPRGADNDVYWLAWSPDGRGLAASYGSGAIVVHDPDTGGARTTIPRLVPAARPAAYAPSGSVLVSSGHLSGTPLELYEIPTGRLFGRLEGTADSTRSLAWSPDGLTIASPETGRPVISTWHARTWRRSGALAWSGPPADEIAFVPGRGWLAAAVPGLGVQFWEPAERRLLRTLSMGSNLVMALAVSSDGRYLAAADRRAIFVWDLRSPTTTR